MPDVTMIPEIASFFGVSTDELFDFNLFEMEKQVEEISHEAYKYRFTDGTESERILREGLQRFPGNDIILNNLLYTLDYLKITTVSTYTVIFSKRKHGIPRSEIYRVVFIY